MAIKGVLTVKDEQGVEHDFLPDTGLDNVICPDGSRLNTKLHGDYTLDEQVIGTWVDGKTIYRKVFEETVAGSRDVTIGKIPANAAVIKLYGVNLSSGGDWITIPLYVSASAMTILKVQKTSGNVVVNTSWPGPVRVIVEYTKTTD